MSRGAAGKPRGGLVIVQEIFGVNSHIKAVTDGFAADGYVGRRRARAGKAAVPRDAPLGRDRQVDPSDHWKQVSAAHPNVPMHVHPAGHGFNCDERGSYHEPSAKLAGTWTLEFLTQHLA